MISSLVISLTFGIFLPMISLSPPAFPEPGIVWLDRQEWDMEILGATWWYDYSLDDKGYPDGFVPYFWCSQWPRFAYGNSRRVDYFEQAAELLGGDYAGWLLFLNEPDLPGSDVDGGQCQMSPTEAAFLYKAVIRDYPQARIVGPAPSHRDYLNGWPWLREWYAIITAWGLPPPEVAAIHTYLQNEYPHLIVDSLFALLADFPGTASTAWVTEFGSCSPEVTRQMITGWQSHPRITRYAWFTARGWLPVCMNLLFGDYALTQSGWMWWRAHSN